MPKPPNLIPTKQLNVALPLPVFSQLMLHLNSDVEGRVPHGAYSRFLTELLRQHFEQGELDLAPYLGVPAGIYTVRGDAVTLEILQRRLA
jgi:hypothetical protein